MAVLVVIVIMLMISEFGASQSNNNTTPIRLSCGSNTAMSSSSFFSNLNSTIDQLRSQLSNNGVYYARAQNLRNQDSVYGLAQCRNYLSTANCVACFDVAVSTVESCSSANGANVFLDDCFLRWVFLVFLILKIISSIFFKTFYIQYIFLQNLKLRIYHSKLTYILCFC